MGKKIKIRETEDKDKIKIVDVFKSLLKILSSDEKESLSEDDNFKKILKESMQENKITAEQSKDIKEAQKRVKTLENYVVKIDKREKDNKKSEELNKKVNTGKAMNIEKKDKEMEQYQRERDE